MPSGISKIAKKLEFLKRNKFKSFRRDSAKTGLSSLQSSVQNAAQLSVKAISKPTV